jgi:hypothetical protein
MDDEGAAVNGLRVGASVSVGDVELITIERRDVNGRTIDDRLVVLATCEPAAIVVCAGGRSWALDAQGGSVSLEALLRELPELRARVSSHDIRATTSDSRS